MTTDTTYLEAFGFRRRQPDFGHCRVRSWESSESGFESLVFENSCGVYKPGSVCESGEWFERHVLLGVLE